MIMSPLTKQRRSECSFLQLLPLPRASLLFRLSPAMVARTSHVFPEGGQSMSHASSTITVVAGLIQQGGRLLVCQRRRDGAFALKWEFPGGKVEPGETYENGLRRELREELGIEAHIGPEAYRTRHDYPGK